MPRPKDSERELIATSTRGKLLEAAVYIFAEKGYVRANIDDISRAAGFAKGTIYNYFSSKRALMEALIEQVSGAHVAYITERVRAKQDPEKQVSAFFEAGFGFVQEYLPQAQVMVNNLYGPDAEFKALMFSAYQPLFGLLAAEVIAPGMAQGRFRQVDPASTAALLMNFYLGVASQVDERGQTWITHEQVTDFVVHALK